MQFRIALPFKVELALACFEAFWVHCNERKSEKFIGMRHSLIRLQGNPDNRETYRIL